MDPRSKDMDADRGQHRDLAKLGDDDVLGLELNNLLDPFFNPRYS